MPTLSPVGRAIADGPKRRRYLMGYVAAVTHRDSEITLTHSGDWSCMWHDAPKTRQTHVWPTKAEALAVARRVFAAYPDSCPYVRAYCYETPNPENARGMPELDGSIDTRPEYVGTVTAAETDSS